MKLLLIVDVIKGFLEQGNMSFTDGKDVVKPIEKLVKEFIENDDMIVTFRDQHEPDALEFKSYPQHCIKGSSEVELLDSLAKYKQHYIDVPKNSTNGVNTKAFSKILKENKFKEVVIVGVCSDICVLQSTLSLITYFYENDINTKVTVVEDAIETFDSPDHSRDYYNEAAKNLMKNASANVVKSYSDIIGQ